MSHQYAPNASNGFALVIGGANVDILGRRTAPGPGPDSIPGTIRQAPGGVARNVAENLARLGHTVQLASRVGQDARGRWLLEQTANAGVDVTHVQQCNDLPTSGYVAVHDVDGTMLSGIADMRVIDSFDPQHLQRLKPALEQAKVLVVDANLPVESLDWLAEQATDAPLFADGVSSAKAGRLNSVVSRLHTLKVNLLEGRVLVGLDSGHWRDCAERLLSSGVSRVVISLGSAGIAFADQEHRIELSAPTPRVRNDTGAGDALMAGLVAAWLKRLALPEQLNYALACAGITLESESASPPSLSDSRVIAWIKEHL